MSAAPHVTEPSPAADATPAGPASPAPEPGDRSPRFRWRPSRRAVLLTALLVIAVLALALTAQGRGGLLDPGSVDPQGSRAVVRILGDQGVDVRPSTTLAQSAAEASSATVLIAGTALPDQAAIEALLAAGPQRVVLVGAFPGEAAFDRLAAGVTLTGEVGTGPLQPGCTLRAATQAGSATVPGVAYDVSAWGGRATGCYTSATSAAVAVLAGGQGRPDVVLLGSTNPLTNAGLDEQGNAALALNLLGSTDRLVWWNPTPFDPAFADDAGASLGELLPDWVRPAAIQLLVAWLVVVLWRGRRLGRLVVEALPVVVPAGETTTGRAQLMASQRARGEAGGQLREQAREQLRRRLGLPRSCPADRLVGEVAFRTGRSQAEVGGLLYGHEPPDDAALVRLDHDLAALTGQVGALEGTR